MTIHDQRDEAVERVGELEAEVEKYKRALERLAEEGQHRFCPGIQRAPLCDEEDRCAECLYEWALSEWKK